MNATLKWRLCHQFEIDDIQGQSAHAVGQHVQDFAVSGSLFKFSCQHAIDEVQRKRANVHKCKCFKLAFFVKVAANDQQNAKVSHQVRDEPHDRPFF